MRVSTVKKEYLPVSASKMREQLYKDRPEISETKRSHNFEKVKEDSIVEISEEAKKLNDNG